MTSGERLTPQQAQADWDRVRSYVYYVRPDVATILNQALAAWQADREALEAAQRANVAIVDSMSADKKVVARHLESLRTLLRRARLWAEHDGECKVCGAEVCRGSKHKTDCVFGAERDAAQGETR